MKKYDIALREKPIEEGLTKDDVIELFDLIDCEEVFPVEYPGEYSTAMGFISVSKADEICYDYAELSYVHKFIVDILNDMDKESSDCEYECDLGKSIVRIWLSR